MTDDTALSATVHELAEGLRLELRAVIVSDAARLRAGGVHADVAASVAALAVVHVLGDLLEGNAHADALAAGVVRILTTRVALAQRGDATIN